MVSLIAAMAKNRVIGKSGKMPWHIPSELRHFRELTLGKVVVMGRKTYEGLPGSLDGRQIVVLSRSKTYHQNGVITCRNFSEVWKSFQEEPEIVIAGGAEIYKQAIDIADSLYLTVIDREYEGDVFFPDFSKKEYLLLSQTEVPGVLETDLPGYTCYTFKKL